MALHALIINSARPLSLGNAVNVNTARGDTVLRKFINEAMKILSGAGKSNPDWVIINDETTLNFFQRSAAFVTVSTSGVQTVTTTVNGGSAISTTFGTSNAATVTAHTAAINADAAAKALLQAHQQVGKVTLVSVAAADSVNIGGVLFTAVTGATTVLGQFRRGVSDTADAADLCRAINTYHGLQMVAANTAGVVLIGLTENRTPRSGDKFLSNSSTITVTTQLGSLTDTIVCIAHLPGALGNCCTFTVGGTGTNAAVSLVSGKLGGGLGVSAATQVITSGMQ